MPASDVIGKPGFNKNWINYHFYKKRGFIMGATHISAYISNETNLSVENYVKKSGIKKGFLIEDALLHHLQALKEIPQDVIIPTRIQLSDSSMEQVFELLENTPEPTAELTTLMRHV